MMANQCVVCGGEMPEGDQVCKLCRAKPFAARGGLAFQRTARQNIDEKTLWRYENGYIPDKVYSNLIRFLENPDNFRNIFEAEKAMLRVDEVEKVKSALTHMNKLEREDCVMVSASLEWLPDNIIDFPQKDVVSTWNRGTRMEYDDEKQRA